MSHAVYETDNAVTGNILNATQVNLDHFGFPRNVSAVLAVGNIPINETEGFPA